MLHIPAESQVLLAAIRNGIDGQFDYVEFGGFTGQLTISKQKLHLTLSHPSIIQIDSRLKAIYSFVDDLKNTRKGQLELCCSFDAASMIDYCMYN